MNQEEKDALKVVFAHYAEQGYTHAKMDYSGSGDSGDIDDCGFIKRDPATQQTLAELDLANRSTDYATLEDLAGNILDDSSVGGYENNDGGQGAIYVDLLTGQVRIDHEWNVITTEEELFTLDLFTEEVEA